MSFLRPRLEDLERDGLTDVALHVGDGDVIPAARFVLCTRSGFFQRLFADVSPKRDADGRCVVRVPFPFPADEVRRAVEWLHAPEASVPGHVVPMDVYRHVRRVCDYLDVSITTELPPNATYDDKLTLIRMAAEAPTAPDATLRGKLHVAMCLPEAFKTAHRLHTAPLDERHLAVLAEWLGFAERVLDLFDDVARGAQPDVQLLVWGAVRYALLTRGMLRESAWRAAVAEQTATRYRVLRLAYPAALIRNMAATLAEGGDRFPPEDERSTDDDPVHALAADAIAGRRPLGSLAGVGNDGVHVLVTALNGTAGTQRVRVPMSADPTKQFILGVVKRNDGVNVTVKRREDTGHGRYYDYAWPVAVYCSWTGRFKYQHELGGPLPLPPGDPEKHFVLAMVLKSPMGL